MIDTKELAARIFVAVITNDITTQVVRYHRDGDDDPDGEGVVVEQWESLLNGLASAADLKEDYAREAIEAAELFERIWTERKR